MSLKPDGTLVLQRDGREVEFAHFSGGEKAASLLLSRLLAMMMATDCRFMWLDEPLEHLDGRNRRMLVNLLLGVAWSGGLKQVVATTYEENVTRHLRKVAREEGYPLSLVYVRADT